MEKTAPTLINSYAAFCLAAVSGFVYLVTKLTAQDLTDVGFRQFITELDDFWHFVAGKIMPAVIEQFFAR